MQTRYACPTQNACVKLVRLVQLSPCSSYPESTPSDSSTLTKMSLITPSSKHCMRPQGARNFLHFENMLHILLELDEKSTFTRGSFGYQGWFRFSELKISGGGFFVSCHFLTAVGVVFFMASHHALPLWSTTEKMSHATET